MLLLLRVEGLLDLLKRLFGAEVRLVVKAIDGLLVLLRHLLLSHLVLEELAIGHVLAPPVLGLDRFHPVHVVDG